MGTRQGNEIGWVKLWESVWEGKLEPKLDFVSLQTTDVAPGSGVRTAKQ